MVDENDKIFELVGFEEEDEETESAVKELLKFLSSQGLLTFRDVGNVDDGSLDDYKKEFNGVKKKLKLGLATWTRFLTLRDAIRKVQVDIIENIRSVSGKVPTSGVYQGIEHLTVFQGLEMLSQTFNDFFAKHKEFDISNVKLEYFSPGDSHSDSLKLLLQDREPIALLPRLEKREQGDEKSKAISLLLSGLEAVNPDAALYADLKDETAEHIVALFGVSGAGKARRIFEILSNEFGFYFLCGMSSDNMNIAQDPGASLFASVIEEATKRVKSIAAIDDSDGTKRLEAVAEAVRLGLLIYCIVLRGLKVKFPAMTPLQWLLIMLFPKVYLGEDIFLQLWDKAVNNGFQKINKANVRSYMTENLDNGQLWVFVDEAQILQSILQYSFPSLTSKDHKEDDASPPFNRDLLSAVCKSFQGVTHDRLRGAVFTGTGFNMISSARAIASGVGKETKSLKIQFTEMEPLNDDGVRNYMNRYLNLDEVENFVVKHCCDWLLGRPRWTASFIQVFVRKMMDGKEPTQNENLLHPFFENKVWEHLKKNNPISAHMFEVIGDFVREMVKQVPSNRDSNYVDTARSRVSGFEKRLPDSTKGLWKDFQGLGFQYLTSGKPVTVSAEDDKFMRYVEQGLCCFADVKLMYKNTAQEEVSVTDSARHIALCEPLMVEALVLEVGITNLCADRMARVSSDTGPSGAGETFESVCIPIIEGLFHGDDDKYQRTSDTIISKMVANLSSHFSGNWTLLKRSYGVVFSQGHDRKDSERQIVQLSNALFDGQYPPLVLPDIKFGGDIVGVVQRFVPSAPLQGRRFINIQIKHSEVLSNGDCHEAHLTTIPELIWTDKRSTAKGEGSALSSSGYEALRKWDGIFRVIIKVPGKIGSTHNKNKMMRVVSRCICWEPAPSSYENESQFESFASNNVEVAKHGHYDCLLVCDGESIIKIQMELVDKILQRDVARFIEAAAVSKWQVRRERGKIITYDDHDDGASDVASDFVSGESVEKMLTA